MRVEAEVGEPMGLREVLASESQAGDFMKANCWFGKKDMRVVDVPEPKILNPRDAIVQVTSTAICGSDLHMYDGFIPTMKKGDIVGHEIMGKVVDTGSGVENLETGERVTVPFPIACGKCFSCEIGLTSLCENSNPNAWIAEEMWGHSTGGLFAARRKSTLFDGYPAYRLHGRGSVRYQKGRHGRGMGMRSGRPVRERISAGRGTRVRDRPLSRTPAHGARKKRVPRSSTTKIPMSMTG